MGQFHSSYLLLGIKNYSLRLGQTLKLCMVGIKRCIAYASKYALAINIMVHLLLGFQ